jgi:hypothetical protein
LVGPAGIVVFPPNARPRGQTTFLLGRRRKATGVPAARHDWGEYLKAWHLIEARLKSGRRKETNRKGSLYPELSGRKARKHRPERHSQFCGTLVPFCSYFVTEDA